MSADSTRVNVVLDKERSLKLRRLAEQTQTNPGTVARSLLSNAIDEEEPDARTIGDFLDRIPGAWDDIAAGAAEADAGQRTPLEEL